MSFFRKIDANHANVKFGSPDAVDEKRNWRVLTLMTPQDWE